MPFNLIEVARLPADVASKFKSDFGIFVDSLIKLRIYGESYRNTLLAEQHKKIVHVIELLRMFSAYTGNPWYENYAMSLSKEEEVTMLAVIQKEREMVMDEGKKEGRKEGRKDLTSVFSMLFKQGRSQDVQRSVEDPAFLKKILEEFGVEDNDDVEKS